MTTELEAVNTMLRAIGQVPVQAIETNPLADSAVAKSVLDEYVAEEQSTGSYFNTADNVETTLNGDGRIPFDSTFTEVRSYYPDRRFMIRGGFLFDLDNQTNVFTTPPRVNTVQQLPFEELPSALQRYVVIRAARVFANRTIGAGEQNAYNQEDEARARAQWRTVEAQQEELNILSTYGGYRPRTFKPVDVIQRRSRYAL